MRISSKGLQLIRQEEGFRPCVYWDPYGRVYTRGIGETEGITSGSKCISEAEGLDNVKRIFNDRYAYALNDLKLNQNQYDALGSFIWNLGPGSMEWDVGRSLREGKYQQAADQMLQYTRAGGVVLPDLVRRRARERALFLTPVQTPINPLRILYPNERKTVEHYLAWHPHPIRNRRRIKKVKNEMKIMRANIYDAAEFGRLRNGKKVSKGWNINNRKARYEILRMYSI